MIRETVAEGRVICSRTSCLLNKVMVIHKELYLLLLQRELMEIIFIRSTGHSQKTSSWSWKFYFYKLISIYILQNIMIFAERILLIVVITLNKYLY